MVKTLPLLTRKAPHPNPLPFRRGEGTCCKTAVMFRKRAWSFPPFGAQSVESHPDVPKPVYALNALSLSLSERERAGVRDFRCHLQVAKRQRAIGALSPDNSDPFDGSLDCFC
jgi:hypothetical protein